MNYANLRISPHVAQRARERGFSMDDIRAVLVWPETTYPSRNPRYPGQQMVIGKGMCIAVNLASRTVCTVFFTGRLASEAAR